MAEHEDFMPGPGDADAAQLGSLAGLGFEARQDVIRERAAQRFEDRQAELDVERNRRRAAELDLAAHTAEWQAAVHQRHQDRLDAQEATEAKRRADQVAALDTADGQAAFLRRMNGAGRS